MNIRICIFLYLLFLGFSFSFPRLIYSQIIGGNSDNGYIYDIIEPKTIEADIDFYMEKYSVGSNASGKKVKADLKADLKYFTAPAITLRYGIIKNLEFQLITGYAVVLTNGTIDIKANKNIFISATKNVSGLSALGFGLKAGLFSNKQVRPSVTIKGLVTLPNIGNSLFTPNNPGVEINLDFYNMINENVDVSYYSGIIWSGYNEDPHYAYAYGISPGYAFSEKFGVYLNFDGIIQKGYTSDNRIDLDFSFNLNDHLSLDAYAGTSFNTKKFYFIGSTFTATVPF